MTIDMQFKNGKHLVNGKELKDLNMQERLFMDSFFREVKLNSMNLENYLLQHENQRVQ